MNEQSIKSTLVTWLEQALGTQCIFTITFNTPFVAGNVINATFDGVAITSVLFTVDSPTTLQALANALFRNYKIFSCYVTGSNQLKVRGATSGDQIVPVVTVTGGSVRPVASFNFTQNAVLVTAIDAMLTTPDGQSAPRPDYPYATFKLGPILTIGEDEQRSEDPLNGIVTFGGQRKQSITIDYFAKTPTVGSFSSPMEPLNQAKNSLGTISVQALFRNVGYAVQEREAVNNISALLDTKFEYHSQFVFYLGFADSAWDSIGVIDDVSLNGVLNQGKPDQVNIPTFTVSDGS